MTSRNRAVIFGKYCNPFQEPMQWYLLFQLAGISHLFFGATSPGGWSDKIDRIACDSTPPPPPQIQLRRCPRSARPQAGPPSWTSYSWAYHTSAKLDDVVEVIPCQPRFAGNHSPIIGLLLWYSDGSCGCVGQCRLDSLSTRLAVVQGTDASPSLLYLAFGRRKGHFHHVERVDTHPPRDQTFEWLSLPWHGLVRRK